MIRLQKQIINAAPTHHDLQTLGLVAAVQGLPPGPDGALVHQAQVVTAPAHLLLVVRHARLVSVLATLKYKKF